MTFKVDKDGWYQCRNPKWVAHVIVGPDLNGWSVTGFIYRDDNVAASSELWHSDGRYLLTDDNQKDLITYIGTERPKRKCTIKMAPALVLLDENKYYITNDVFKSEKEAKTNSKYFTFIRWLIDTHAVEVEVGE